MDNTSNLVPTDDLPSEIQPISSAPSQAVPADDLPDEVKPEDNSHPMLASAEGAMRSLTLGGSDAILRGARSLAEKQDLIPPDWIAPKTEDVAARSETSAGKTGQIAGLVGGLMTGAGALGPLASGAKAATAGVGAGLEALGLTVGPKMAALGATALTGALEAGAIQGGDEISKALLGQPGGDPEAAVSSALANIGGAMLLGGGLNTVLGTGGIALKGLANTKAANAAADWASDFGNRWAYNTGVGDLASKLHEELSNFHTMIKDAAGDVYGATGLKAQAIKKLVPEMHEGIVAQNQEINNTLQKTLDKMTADPKSYPEQFAGKLQDEVNKWRTAVTDPDADAAARFHATQDLKQVLQGWSKFEKRITPFSPEADFVNDAKSLQHKLKESLEDPEVWGKAADLQRGVNGAFTEFLPALKDFEKRFTSKIGDEAVIDPGKVSTYANQLGKPSAEIKQDIMSNFVDASEKYRNQINRLHDNLGVENGVAPQPLNALKGTLDKDLPEGAKAADYVYRKGLNQVTDPVAQQIAAVETGRRIGNAVGMGAPGAGTVGAGIGYITAKSMGPFLNNVIGRPLKAVSQHGISALLNVIKSGDMTGIPEALQYSQHISKGQKAISNGIDGLFKAGRQEISSNVNTEKNRQKIKDYIDNGGINQVFTPQTPQSTQPSGYAEGGEVLPQDTRPQEQSDPIAQHFPTQNMLLNAAKGRISGYLTSMKPTPNPQKLPFDPPVDTTVQDRNYDRAIDIANNPLDILNDVKDGSIQASDVKHFTQMYPELHQHLSKEITKRIMQAQLNDESPSYKTKVAMSLFLGQPLDSTMTPTSIQNAQITYLPKQPLQQPQGQTKTGGKKGTSTLGKSNKSYKTTTQAAESDRNDRD